jgi:endonuclease I
MDDSCQAGACRGVPLDADRDGHASRACGGDDCDDREPGVHPGADEGPPGAPACSNRLDDDCDGLTDLQDPGCLVCVEDEDCDDLDPCNGLERCLGNACQAGEPRVCEDQNPCTDDRCGPGGVCLFVPVDGPCDDGDACTTGDACRDGLCAPGARTCECQRDADCAPYEDGNDCNGRMFCSGGLCLLDPASPVVCDTSADGPCGQTVCQPATGQCAFSLKADGALCDDGDPCTVTSTCRGGDCLPGPLVDADGDGYPPIACGGGDCDELRASVHPGAEEICQDGLDNDCDGLVDTHDGCPAAQDAYAGLAGLGGQALRDALQDRIDGHADLSYDAARAYLYGTLDNQAGQVQCVYTGTWVATTGIPPVEVMNTEHAWCQSWGADTRPMKSDLHHLFPAVAEANLRRGNAPYGRVVQPFWALGGSAVGFDARRRVVFEVRPEHRGDAARAIFYYAVRYGVAIEEAAELLNYPDDVMEAELRRWNAEDPPDARERARCDAIQGRQGNRNPFVDRPGFVDRISDF